MKKLISGLILAIIGIYTLFTYQIYIISSIVYIVGIWFILAGSFEYLNRKP